ncbi:MAG: transposase [Chloroflexi bacterium]|nr:transposase [Chloroflexota bacterium]
MTREERRERCPAVLHDARAVYQGNDEGEIRKRLAAFRERWAESEPKAVATLERDFDRTLAYLKVRERARQDGQEWRVECLRTASPPERINRHFRQKARQVTVAHSQRGADATIELVIYHHGLLLDQTSGEPWTRCIEEALLAA